MRVAEVASNLVTYDSTTGELMDSGGLFSNKLAVVSEQPPIALTGASTVVTNHGTYTIEASSGTVVNLFDKVIGETNKWQTDNGTYDSETGNYNNVSTSLVTEIGGEWAKITMPYKTILRHVKIESTNSSIKDVTLVGLNSDGLTWSDLKTVTGLTGTTHTIIVNATTHHRTYGLIVRATNVGSSQAEINDLKLFTESFSIDGGKVEMATSMVMGGETTMDQHGPHSRDPKAVPLKKYPDIAFESGKFDYNTTTNTFVQAGYTITSSGNFSDDVNSVYTAWRAFTGLINLFDPGWVSPSGSYTGGVANSTQSLTNIDTATSTGSVSSRNGAWIKLELPTKIKLGRVDFYDRYDDIEGTATQYERVSEAFVYGGNSNSGPWYEIGKQSDATNLANYTDNIPASLTIDTTSYYKYYIIQPTQLAKTISYASYGQLMFYGYEELATEGDTSVDTTFTSIMNTPQTTGANVYIDGNLGETLTNRVTGPDVTGPSATYDSTGKYWELNGTLTSNIAVEANTFLEGDQPHAVSVWFNSSNLEANVSNTCVFSISDQEKLDSVNLDLQSNTWHNLTYAYQGEGGSRVTYLDGRKVAEDQAEDTFGDYPPFAMTGYSQGGYTVSASSEYLSDVNALRNAYKVYNPTTGTADVWMTEFSTFNPNAVGGDTFTDSDGGTHTGHWNKIELPYKLKPSYFYFKNSGTFTGSRNATNWVILGSNNDSEWDLLHSSTTVLNATKSIPITATKGYTYLMFLCKSVNADTALYMDEIRYYGHRENDLVRLPDPTNVLKYPHVAMTGPAQRGYVASASTEYTTYSAWNGFDDIQSGNGIQNHWSGSSQKYDTSDGDWSGDTASVYTTNVEGVNKYGEWLQIEFPYKIKYNYSQIKAPYDRAERQPRDGYIVGSNDLSGQWTTLHRFTGVTRSSATETVTYTPSSASTTAFKYIRLVIEAITGSTGQYAGIDEWDIYGTEEASQVPIQIGGGNIDKVANFRVYDKFIGEDQALEIWDAQKDEFGRAKSSMTLQKGRLGLGTTEPEGRLAVLDEPHNLEEFPPRAMTGYKTYFEGHGEFKVIDSTFHAGGQEGWQAFNGIYGVSGNGDAWLSGNVPTYNADGTSTGISSINGEAGEYVILEMPYRVKMKNVLVYPRGHNSSTQSYSNPPKDGKIWGRNDADDFWTEIASYTNLNFGATITDNLNGQHPQHVVINATQYYKYIAFQVQVANHNLSTTTVYTNIRELRYFGTREQGQSVLHDGQLTLTKSLTVPRIGPALDADDTPRRDRLVVEYNTSTNPTFEGAVRDTSGRGNDGVFYGGASYDATEKALVFDGTDDYITTRIHNQPGDWIHSISFWVKFTNLTGVDTEAPFQIGPGTGAAISKYSALDWTSAQLNWYFFSNDLDTSYALGTGASKWIHFACVYEGGGAASSRHIYLDGINISSYYASSPSNPLNFNSNQVLTLGRDSDRASTDPSYFHGSISNFKLYDVALTAEEVKTLYDMGRTGHIVNPQPLHIAAPVQVEKTLRIPVDNTYTGAYTAGMIRYNQDLGKIQVHNGSGWLTIDGGVSATGGTVTYADGYTIHTFTDSGTFTVYSGGDIEYLVVAGGGGGGKNAGAGGGAGGMRSGTLTGIGNDTYAITVGEGGAGGTTDQTGTLASKGSDSSIAELVTAEGGGAGVNSGGTTGGNGGSGGGAGNDGTGNQNGGNGASGQGNNGGAGTIPGGAGRTGGGGGGAGAVGQNSVSATQAGNGGIGRQSDITGTMTYYAGGGGGGVHNGTGGTGGLGGGGGENEAGTDGLGGGGGAARSGDGNGKKGGSGIVIIRYI